MSSRAELTPQIATQARLLRIEDTRRDEPALIDSLLERGTAQERAAAALTVGRIGARAHVATVRRLASDLDTGVAGNALFTLGLLEDTASASIAAAALRVGAGQGVEAAWLLGELGDLGRAAIIAGIANTALDAATRGALLLAATRLRPVPAPAGYHCSPAAIVGWPGAQPTSLPAVGAPPACGNSSQGAPRGGHRSESRSHEAARRVSRATHSARWPAKRSCA